MSRAKFNRGVAGVAIALAVGLAGSMACGAEPPEAVATILAAVDKADASTLRQARAAFDANVEERRREVRLGYAMALAYMQNAKFEQAAQIVDKLPASQSKSIPIRRLRLWLAVQLKDTEQISKLFGELASGAATGKSSPETQTTVLLLAGLSALVKQRSAADGGGDSLAPACRELTSSLSTELLKTFNDETERVTQAIGKRSISQSPEQAAAAEALAAKIREAQPRVAALQEQFKEGDAAFHKEQAELMQKLKPERAELKKLQRSLQSVNAGREPPKPKEPREQRDAKGNKAPPSAQEMARYQQELRNWEHQVTQNRTEREQNQAKIKDQMRAHSSTVEKLQQELAAAVARNNEPKHELSQQTKVLKDLQHERDKLDAIDELSPATFEILPLEAEKERILQSYRR